MKRTDFAGYGPDDYRTHVQIWGALTEDLFGQEELRPMVVPHYNPWSASMLNSNPPYLLLNGNYTAEVNRYRARSPGAMLLGYDKINDEDQESYNTANGFTVYW